MLSIFYEVVYYGEVFCECVGCSCRCGYWLWWRLGFGGGIFGCFGGWLRYDVIFLGG